MKNMKIFQNGQIELGDLPIDENIQRFFQSGQTASSDLPIDEKFKAFSKMVKLS
jgi:hypothetical protein